MQNTLRIINYRVARSGSTLAAMHAGDGGDVRRALRIRSHSRRRAATKISGRRHFTADSIALGVQPVAPSNPDNIVNYDFSITDGQSFSQTIPVQICSGNHQTPGTPPSWNSYDIGPNTVGGNLSGSTTISPPTLNFTFAEDGACKAFNILISTGPLNLTNPNIGQTFVAIINNISLQASDAPSQGGPKI